MARFGKTAEHRAAGAAWRAWLVAACLVAGAPAHAQEGYAAREDCAKTNPSGDIIECLELKVTRSNADLDEMEAHYRAALDSAQTDAPAKDAAKTAFEASAVEFRRYRDKQCDFVQTQEAADSGQLRLACIVELDALRIDELDVALRKLQ